MRLPLHSPRTLVTLVVFVVLAALPLLTQAFDQRYLLSIGTRIVIWSIAATSLNMILGYGGMVSFGHAALFGIGGYAVGILSASGIQDGWIQWPVALLASAAWATLVGALSLRTRGVYFIMITLAFAQLVYYLSSGLEAYGGDDGLNISRSRFPGLIDLRDKASFYWLCLVLLAGTLWFSSRLAVSRFGYVLRGTWHYLEHDWVAKEGDWLYEPPGETHTLVVPEGCDEMITLFTVNAAMVYVDPWGKTTGFEDVFTKIEMCRRHYAECGLGADYVDQFVR